MEGQSQADFEVQAREYLAAQLPGGAVPPLGLAGVFDEQPLIGEGRTAVFAFELPAAAFAAGKAGEANVAAEAGGARRTAYYVAVGETEPNYFPAYGLSPEEAFSLHLGTRFMLVMNVARVDAAEEPPGAREAVERFARECAPAAELRRLELAALFRCDRQHFAVYRVQLGDEQAYCLGADLPPGFYRLIEHPPQVAVRLHLGQLMRREAAEVRREKRRAAAPRR